MRRSYNVAGFVFSVALIGERDIDALLPSFIGFKAEECKDKLFEFEEADTFLLRGDATFLDEDRNDMGHTILFRTKLGYRIEMNFAEGVVSVVETDSSFRRAKAYVRWDDRYVSSVLSSMLRVVFAQAILLHNAVSLHSSVVVCEGKAFVFMGKSGTGKSTHSRLWLEHIEGSWLLNDDNPILKVEDVDIRVYGSPWSGKTHCYFDESAPVAGIVRLKQAPYNRFRRCEDIDAFSVVLPGCSVIRMDAVLHDALCATLTELIGRTIVGEMECLPYEGAAEICKEGILRN